jgi:hypothetical protein
MAETIVIEREGHAIIHLIDSNVFIPIGLDAKVFLNLAPQSFQKFCQAKKDRLFHFLRRDSLWDVTDLFSPDVHPSFGL